MVAQNRHCATDESTASSTTAASTALDANWSISVHCRLKNSGQASSSNPRVVEEHDLSELEDTWGMKQQDLSLFMANASTSALSTITRKTKWAAP
jgi:hypothetical protein